MRRAGQRATTARTRLGMVTGTRLGMVTVTGRDVICHPSCPRGHSHSLGRGVLSPPDRPCQHRSAPGGFHGKSMGKGWKKQGKRMGIAWEKPGCCPACLLSPLLTPSVTAAPQLWQQTPARGGHREPKAALGWGWGWSRALCPALGAGGSSEPPLKPGLAQPSPAGGGSALQCPPGQVAVSLGLCRRCGALPEFSARCIPKSPPSPGTAQSVPALPLPGPTDTPQPGGRFGARRG